MDQPKKLVNIEHISKKQKGVVHKLKCPIVNLAGLPIFIYLMIVTLL